ncbi:MAG TPA: LacI family DNA-binding transcriptional regulator [Oleiagrimonas sp.]|nr:LacI family DNA-binding transcriptional regulator [Oleiagrimonas sp.]
MSVTIKDVAKAAGVSVASVSRALNGHDNVTRDTCERIMQAAQQLHYMPNGAARSLITRRTQTIGALLPDLHGAFFSELIRGIDRAARARGLHLLVSSSHDNADEAAATLRAMRGRVDGLLVMSPHASPGFLSDNLPPELPTVLMSTGGDDDHHARLTVDNHGGAWAMTRHLIDGGYQRIAFVCGPEHNIDAAERLRGYRDAMGKLADAPGCCVLSGDFSEQAGYDAGHQLLGMDPRPQAVFAANDMMALGVLAACNEAGMSVPEDMALAGFDDIPMARYMTPSLSTVRIHIADFGERALARLVETIDQADDKPTTEEVIPTELVVRTSCGVPANNVLPLDAGAAHAAADHAFEDRGQP